MRSISIFLGMAFVVMLSISSCSSTVNLRIPVKQPPMVFLPDHIQSVGIINRSLASADDGGKVLSTIEGVVSGEGLFEDKNGSAACVSGVETQLNIDQLVQARNLESVELTGTGTATMPLQLSWEEVERICKENEVDGLLVLEFFDTDQQNTTTTNAVSQIRNISRTGTVGPVQGGSNARVYVKMGWRFYDYKDHILLDEIRMNDYFAVNGNSRSIVDLGEFAKRDAIQQCGYMAGVAYAGRLLPYYVNVYRQYYQRKGDEMARAKRLAEVNNWQEAMEIWEPLTRDSNRKLAGRAAYNMAIGYEVLGDIPLAIEWAEEAYTQHREKRARDYQRILKNRLNGQL